MLKVNHINKIGTEFKKGLTILNKLGIRCLIKKGVHLNERLFIKINFILELQISN